MIRRPPRSTLDRSSAASDVYKRQKYDNIAERKAATMGSVYQINLSAKVYDSKAQPTKIHCYIDTKKNLKSIDVSVSYTHLRAHETVLDLVCRLLLEKKKHKKTQKNKNNKKKKKHKQ